MNDDGDNTDCDGVAGDDLECVDGFKNQINRSCLAVAQLTTLCILSHDQLCPLLAPAAAEFDQIDISSEVKA